MKEFLSFVHDFKNGGGLIGINVKNPTKVWYFNYKGMEMKSHDVMPIDNYKISMYGFNKVDRERVVRFMKFNYNQAAFQGDDFEKPFEKILLHYEDDDNHIINEEWILGIHENEILTYYIEKVKHYIHHFKKMRESDDNMINYYERQLIDMKKIMN